MRKVAFITVHGIPCEKKSEILNLSNIYQGKMSYVLTYSVKIIAIILITFGN